MATRGKDLPPEVLEKVLACLPVQDLCRFRVVCKAWNHLMSEPGFASLCALAPRQASYVLITPKIVDLDLTKETDLEILDVAEKRFYSLCHPLFHSNSFRSDTDSDCQGDMFMKRKWRLTLAADKGLVYLLWISIGRRREWHIVCNPFSKSFHTIPKPVFQINYNRESIVVMTVDNVTQRYRIVMLEERDNITRPVDIYLYDSTTVKWRKLCGFPEFGYCAYSGTFLNGVFYVLFMNFVSVPWYPTLYSCNLENGAWSHIDVDLPRPSHPQDKSQLVVALGRLFIVEYTGIPRDYSTAWELNRKPKKHVIKVGISEILLAEKEVNIWRMAELRKYSKYPRKVVDEPRLMDHPPVAVGCGGLIVISSKFGPCVAWDLLKNRWLDLPTNTNHIAGNQGMYAGLVHLDMREMTS
ncbi:hypothetical protein M758_1G170600 [Ceratodon purpureus]|nr:hypothetical protein M758_1G170600 [Ceratodon purpureus]